MVTTTHYAMPGLSRDTLGYTVMSLCLEYRSYWFPSHCEGSGWTQVQVVQRAFSALLLGRSAEWTCRKSYWQSVDSAEKVPAEKVPADPPDLWDQGGRAFRHSRLIRVKQHPVPLAALGRWRELSSMQPSSSSPVSPRSPQSKKKSNRAAKTSEARGA